MTKSNDSSRPEFWDMRFASGRTPWDFQGVPAALKSFLKTSLAGKALIPGCGTGYEVRAFHDAGWEVTAIDFSPVAAEQAWSYLGKLARCVVLGDFFKHDFAERSFDLVYERTFLCPLPPRLWRAYASRIAPLLRPSGRLAGIFFYGDESEPPPYPLTEKQAQELFEAEFTLARSIPVEDSLLLFAGMEQWQEWERRA